MAEEAQRVIDALRLVPDLVAGEKSRNRLTDALLAKAPETDKESPDAENEAFRLILFTAKELGGGMRVNVASEPEGTPE